MKKAFALLFILFFFQLLCFSQNQHKIDSLEGELKKFEVKKMEPGNRTSAMFDTTKAYILNHISEEYYGFNTIKILEYAQQGLVIFKQLGFKKGISYSYLNIGDGYYEQSNFPEAIKYWLIALQTAEEIGYKYGVSAAYNNLGIVYNQQGNYPEALDKFLAALKISEETGDKRGMAYAYGSSGSVLVNLGKYRKALEAQFASIKVAGEIGDSLSIGFAYNNIGFLYFKQGYYEEALKNHFISLRISKEIGMKDLISTTYNNIGTAYEKLGNLTEASRFTNRALASARELGFLFEVKEAYKELAVIDSARNNFKGAFENNKRYMQVNDSIFNMEKEKKLTSLQMQYDFDKRETLTIASQEKKDAIAAKELQKQKLVRNGFVFGFAVVFLFAGMFFIQRNKISKGKKRSDELLLNILPSEVAEELKQKGSADARQFDEVTVMFTDFKGFTQISERLSPAELVAEIHSCFKAFDNIIEMHNIEKIKTIGDSYMCAGGLPVANTTHATDVVSAALEIQQFMQEHLQQRKRENKEPFELRIGVHTGSVVAGIVGVKKFAYDIWGDTVNIASRVESSGEAGKVNISGYTYQLVKDKFNCVHRGKVHAKNKGEIDMYFVEARH